MTIPVIVRIFQDPAGDWILTSQYPGKPVFKNRFDSQAACTFYASNHFPGVVPEIVVEHQLGLFDLVGIKAVRTLP